MKMKVAEQLAMMTVGTTKRSAKPTRKKVMAIETRRPRKRQVDRETRRVVVAKARKRASGRPVNAVWVVRKACMVSLMGVFRCYRTTYGYFGVLMGIVSGSLKHVLALLGWKDLVGGRLDLVTDSSRGIMDLVSEVVDHVASCLEDGGHSEVGEIGALGSSTVVNESMDGDDG